MRNEDFAKYGAFVSQVVHIVLSSKLHYKLPFLSNETLFKLFLKTQLNVDNRSHFKIYPGKTLMRI